ncbi:uncharacterized protein LOC121731300 [Aricia agestis]|uniref:uncharacterized protein LOC121731300 n=1 Tax=Aricia agestis TaxID=91739 RepID=UPI001C203301|nr:uncharacterized protein LOC121731300 [Aricia agestis]
MSLRLQLIVFACVVLAVSAAPAPDSGGHVPLPGPGLSYGGIPYGSMSGNVAAYYKRAPSIPIYSNLRRAPEADYPGVLQYL